VGDQVTISLRDRAILVSATARLDELLSVCKRGSALFCHAPNLARDVTRKAETLRTALAGLTAALDGKPQSETLSSGQPSLLYRLYSQPLLHKMVRFVRYGRSEIEFWDLYREMAQQYTQEKASAAVDELFDIDASALPATVRLKPHVLPLCKALLGPEPGKER
jgi:hypothetical protein